MATTKTTYETIIGLEIHVQLDTKTKMFCRCDNNSDNVKPNTNVCPVCMGYPGVLPVINNQAIEWGIKTSLALGCIINPMQRFDRKNYFYPDLPKGYQISQFFYPVGEKGRVVVDYLAFDRKTKKEFEVGITRLHLEEDAGKLVHVKDGTLIDLNRCGTPLVEIVTEPDIKSPKEARAFMLELQRIVRALGVSQADMEKGHLRVDANISVRPKGQIEFGTKVEVKNMNSFKFVEQALKYEIARQIEVLEDGGVMELETRGWDEKSGTTVSQRGKEESTDYRYFPEPDLPPIYVDKKQIAEIQKQLTMLPNALRAAAVKLGLPYPRISELQDRGELDNFLNLINKNRSLDPIKTMEPYIYFVRLEQSREISTEDEDKFFEWYGKERPSSAVYRRVVDNMLAGKSFEIASESIKSVSGSELEKVIQRVLDDNLDAVEKYKAGEEKVLSFLMGQVMAKTKGSTEPALVQQILKRLLTK